MFYKKAFQIIDKIHRKMSVLESLSNTVKGLQAVRLATLLKANPRIDVSESAVCKCYLKSDSYLPKKIIFIYFNESSLRWKNDEKYFLFHFKSSSRSQDIYIFVLTFWPCRIVSLQDFVYDFSRKMFLLLHSINRPNFIAWLHLLLEIFVNMCIATVC